MNAPESGERRSEPRQEIAQIGTILSKNGSKTDARYCLVTEISNAGVRIRTAGYKVPRQFALRFPGLGPERDGQYEVIWQRGDDVGAKRVSAAAMKAAS